MLSPARRRGTHCQNVYVTPPIVLLFLAVFSKQSGSFSQSTSVSSALEALTMMRYINLRFTLHYITLHSTKQNIYHCTFPTIPIAKPCHMHPGNRQNLSVSLRRQTVYLDRWHTFVGLRPLPHSVASRLRRANNCLTELTLVKH